MEQYIPKSALVAELERRIKETESMQPKFDQFWAGQISAFKGVLKILNSLEVKDLNSDDAFIEKATEWLNNNLWDYYDTGSIGDFEILKFEHFTQMIEDFKLAMKI